MEGLAGLLPFVLIAVVFWVLLIRPQRRRQLALLETQRGLQVGDEVMLGAGVLGTVTRIGDDDLVIETTPGVHLRVVRAAVARVIDRAPDDGAVAPSVAPSVHTASDTGDDTGDGRDTGSTSYTPSTESSRDH